MRESDAKHGRRRPSSLHGSAQAEDVLHIEQAIAAPAKEARRAHRAERIRHATARLVRDLDALADAGEQHGVIPDHVAAANRREADGLALALAGVPITAVDSKIAVSEH